MKKTITFILLITLMITTVIMPYANYEDAKVLISIYNNSMKDDQDMNFAEFVGEKLIASGINFDEDEENHTKKIPDNNHSLITQIQSGVIFHKKDIPLEYKLYPSPKNNYTVSKVSITQNNFQLGILRPPIC